MVAVVAGADAAALQRHAADVVLRQRREELRHDARRRRVLESGGQADQRRFALNAVPMKLIPSGTPKTFPIGTLTIG
jgi:hypothetical protein